MDETKAVNTTVPAAEQTEVTTVVDNEAIIAALEAEKAKLTTERDNYKIGMLKEKAKSKGEDFEEEDDERMERIAKKALADSRLAEIAREQDTIIRAALKENKELKLARLNKNETTTVKGSSTESTPVRDTLVTQEQMRHFTEVLKWDANKIERYKKNIQKVAGR